MTKKESIPRVVGIGIGVAILVMKPVIPGPNVYAILWRMHQKCSGLQNWILLLYFKFIGTIIG